MTLNQYIKQTKGYIEVIEMTEQELRLSKVGVKHSFQDIEHDIRILQEMVEYVHRNVDKATLDNYQEFNDRIIDFNNQLLALQIGGGEK